MKIPMISYVSQCLYVEYLLNPKMTILNELFYKKVLAHELGHTFGMHHDFHSSHGGWNGACNGKGIMSYGSYDYKQWSECSRADFEEHYSYYNWSSCLDDISGSFLLEFLHNPTDY